VAADCEAALPPKESVQSFALARLDAATVAPKTIASAANEVEMRERFMRITIGID
jgi:hypothetical protein